MKKNDGFRVNLTDAVQTKSFKCNLSQVREKNEKC